nr:hypothetical protein BaRGS_009843 [Batillaria attramentaria]
MWTLLCLVAILAVHTIGAQGSMYETFFKNVNVQDGDLPENAVQIQPQHVRIKIRPNKPVRVPITFRQAENYPVDLYYLMDLSNSMEDDKASLARLGNLIAERMSAITKNFRLGFGSFVDKVKQVNDASVSGNLDAPEGGFDAIMQAAACDNEIGWRNVSRRMLVFSTDAGFHYAGDGKLGGIVRPNDGKCHMRNNIYTESSNQDYPSVSQVIAKLKERSVSIIFAVTEDQFPVYEKLGRLIESSSTGKLANDSSNIVTLIEDNYSKIASQVTLKTENVGENITVKFYSRCFGTEEQQTNECKGIKIGQNVTFVADVMVTQCPKERGRWKQGFNIYPAGLAERLYMELDIICECDCEKTGACPGKCEENRDCVQCTVFKSGKLKDELLCRQKCRQDLIRVRDTLEVRPGVRKCQFRDDDDCLFSFTYEYLPRGEVQITVQQTKACPESVNVLAIVGGVVGGIVAVGLALLLIWKLLTFIHDRREFAKFEKERQNAKWDTGGNPIYKQATSTFTNPTYSGKQG